MSGAVARGAGKAIYAHAGVFLFPRYGLLDGVLLLMNISYERFRVPFLTITLLCPCRLRQVRGGRLRELWLHQARCRHYHDRPGPRPGVEGADLPSVPELETLVAGHSMISLQRQGRSHGHFCNVAC